MMRIILYVLLLFITNNTIVLANVDLLTTYKLALDNREDFKIAKTQLAVQTQLNRQTNFDLLPQVSALNQYSKNLDNNPFLDSSDRYNSLRLTQSVFDYSKIISYQKTDQDSAVAQLRYEANIQDLIYNTTQAYFEVLDSQVALQYAKLHSQDIKKHLEGVRQRYQLRQLGKVDLIESEESYEAAKLDERRIKNQLSNRKYILGNYIGQDNIQKGVKSASYQLLDKFNTNNNFDDWMKIAKKNSHSVRLREAQLKSDNLNVDIANAGHLPTVNFSADYNFNSDFLADRVYSLQLSIPIFQGFLIDARVSQAKIVENQSQLNLDKARKVLHQSIRNAYDDFTYYQARIKALKTIVQKNLVKLQATKEGFNVNLRTSNDVIFASSELRDANQNYRQAIHQYILSYLSSKRISGVLSQNDIEFINGIFFVTG